MLRPVVLAIATALAVAACALVEPPPPQGTVLVQLQVANHSPLPAQLAVKGSTGLVIAGAAQPDVIAPGATAQVRFFVPIGIDWMIAVNGLDLIMRSDLAGRTGVINSIGIEVGPQNQDVTWWCRANCP